MCLSVALSKHVSRVNVGRTEDKTWGMRRVAKQLKQRMPPIVLTSRHRSSFSTAAAAAPAATSSDCGDTVSEAGADVPSNSALVRAGLLNRALAGALAALPALPAALALFCCAAAAATAAALALVTVAASCCCCCCCCEGSCSSIAAFCGSGVEQGGFGGCTLFGHM